MKTLVSVLFAGGLVLGSLGCQKAASTPAAGKGCGKCGTAACACAKGTTECKKCGKAKCECKPEAKPATPPATPPAEKK